MADSRTRTGRRQKRGRVATFFSFKGGVGRTMALANCAFVAAMNGTRVLVMDWDLEAPGLPYYFRGLIDRRAAADMQRSVGVLDLFWRWQRAVDDAKSADDLAERLAPFHDHQAFAQCVHPLVDQQRLPAGGCIDIITAGAQTILCPEPTAYADALSRFNWTRFFARAAGGTFIFELRKWCQANYDLVLIDSRTGLADVAGICTMQIPDTVVLSFVFNRQNIDGSAQVARSILAARQDEIAVRIVPMRVSKERPAEESDARSRAAREFKRAGLPPAQVDRDLAGLSVPATSGVPYYEALAPFFANEHSAGDLNWAYARLTGQLLGREISPLVVDPAWSEEMRKRLQPTVVTIEYLRELETADPDRAVDEIERFLEGALDADPSMEIGPDYVRALVAAAIDAVDRVYESDDDQIRAIGDKTLRLIEQMHLLGEDDWRGDFIEALDELDYRIVQTPAESLVLILWLEKILAEGPQNGDILIRRANNSIILAQNARDSDGPAAALAYADRAQALSRDAEEAGVPTEQLERISVQLADLRARILFPLDREAAMTQFALLFSAVAKSEDSRVQVMGAAAHLFLAENEPERRRDHYLAAVELAPRRVMRNLDQLKSIVTEFIDADDEDQQLVYVASRLFKEAKQHRILPSYGRTTESATEFATLAIRLARKLARIEPDDIGEIIVGIGEMSGRVLSQWTRRKAKCIEAEGAASAEAMIERYGTLAERLQAMGIAGRALARLRRAIKTADDEEEEE